VKNLPRLIDAFARLLAAGRDLDLVLTGEHGSFTAALAQHAARAGVLPRVRMPGYLPRADLLALYRAAAVVVYPSLTEGFGLPVLEAMTRGIPVIVSNTSSLPEVTGDAALGVNPRSIREIAAAIETLCTDVDLAEKLASAGRQRAERFSWDETARRTLQVYERVLNAKER